MEIATFIVDLLHHYTARVNKAKVQFTVFWEYVRKYAHHYAEEKPQIAEYSTISQGALQKELDDLKDKGLVDIIKDTKNNTLIIDPMFFVTKIKQTYERVGKNPDIPFPLVDEVPERVLHRFSKTLNLASDIGEFLSAVPDPLMLYRLVFPDGVVQMLFPGNFTYDILLEFAVAKIRLFLAGDDSRDYIRKRLVIANPGKEFSIKSFLMKFQSHSKIIIDAIKTADDAYILRGQLCSFIRQEFSKKQEKMAGETALLQSVTIVEYFNNYYRNKQQQDMQRVTALKNLKAAFKQKPYFFTLKEIIKFVDSRGIPLLGQFSEEDLDRFITTSTAPGETGEIPMLLGFTNDQAEQCYVSSENILPLLLSFLNKARKPIYDVCVQTWRKQLLRFEQSPAMNSDAAFNEFVQMQCEHLMPNLNALLYHPLLLSVVDDLRTRNIYQAEIARLFPHGTLRSVAELIPLHRQEILADTKILLPIWYTIPVISWILSLFRRKKGRNSVQKKNEQTQEQKSTHPKEPVNSALKLEFLPAETNIESALEKRLDTWNQNIDPVKRENITLDVNAYIKDYARHIKKQLKNTPFDANQVRRVAKTLSESHSLQKITNRKALRQYIELYLVKIVEHDHL